MFGKVKNFAMRKLVDRKLKDAPPEQKELIMTLMEKDPALFEKISKEIQAEIKSGKSEMAAAMKVMPKYQAQMRAIMGNKLPQQRVGGTRFNSNGTIHK
jgi:hypothetical protein